MDTLLSYLLRFAVGGGVYVDAAMAANYTVNLTIGTMSPHFYNLAPASADRQFILPDPAATLIGVPFLVSNSAAGGGYNVLVRGKTLTYTGTLSSASTIGTIPPGVTAYAICYDDGTYFRWKYQALSSADALTLTGALTAGGIINNSTLDQNGNIDHDTTQTGSGAGLDTLAQVSSATGSPDAVVVGLTQITNNRTAGTATAVDITVTGRAGDTSGGTYEAIRGTFVRAAGSAIAIFAKVSAGFSHLFDLTDVATGEADVVVKDNLADAFGIREAANYYIKVVTTAGAKLVAFGQGIASDTISELTATSGVTVDGCLIKDGRVAALAVSSQTMSAEQTGTGAPQTVAHSIGSTPTIVQVIPTDTTSGWVVTGLSVDGTNVTVTVTLGAKFRVFSFK